MIDYSGHPLFEETTHEQMQRLLYLKQRPKHSMVCLKRGEETLWSRSHEQMFPLNIIMAEDLMEGSVPYDSNYDTIGVSLAAGLCLDWPTQLKQWHQSLRPGGLLSLAILSHGSFEELANAWSCWDAPEAHIPRGFEMNDVGHLLKSAGFIDSVLDVSSYQLSFSSLQDIWRHLRRLGWKPRAHGRSRALFSTQTLQKVEAAYPRDGEGKACLGIRVMYVHTFAAHLSVGPEDVSIPWSRSRRTPKTETG